MRFLPCLLVLVPLAAACGGSGGRLQAPSGGALAPYDAPARALYPDTIDPAAVGLTVLAISGHGDTELHDRIVTAEVVARVRVTTVTADTAGGQPTFHLVVRAIGQPLTKGEPATEPFELDMGTASPSYGMVKALDARLVGRQFIAILRRFYSDAGPVLHFHLMPDDKATATAIAEIVDKSDLARH